MTPGVGQRYGSVPAETRVPEEGKIDTCTERGGGGGGGGGERSNIPNLRLLGALVTDHYIVNRPLDHYIVHIINMQM